MQIVKKFSISFLILSSLMLTSCVETVVFGTVASAVIVTREKTLKNTFSDVKIAAQIDSYLLKNQMKTPLSSVDVMVNEGRVLLTGNLSDFEKAKKANEIAWSVGGVKEVIDEINLIDEKNFKLNKITKTFGDYLITSHIKSRLFFARGIYSRNYKITTIAGKVYILGVTHNKGEISRMLKIVSTTRGVKEVVNHALFIDDERRH